MPVRFFKACLFSTDHRIVARQFLLLSLAWLAAAMLTAQDAGSGLLPGLESLPSALGVSIVIFFLAAPLTLGIFANGLVPEKIGTNEMAFPALTMCSFWAMLCSFCCMALSLFLPGAATAEGWVSQPPLIQSSYLQQLPFVAQQLSVCSLALAGTASLIGAINQLTTILQTRPPSRALSTMPIAAWIVFVPAVLQLLVVPILAAFMLILGTK